MWETTMTEQGNKYETELISIVAHDLKAPISATRGFIELIEQVGSLNDKQTYFLNRAFSSLTRMEEIIEGLLDYVQIETGLTLQIELLNISDLIDHEIEFMGELAAQNEITIHFDRDSKCPKVAIDARLIRHVISNLLSNAIKYNRKGGDIWISAVAQANVLRVSVRDNGLGIPEKRLPYVFDRFVRAHEDTDINGTGLGLAICRSIIKLHKGHIWVESEQHKGSIFSFTLPLVQSKTNPGYLMPMETAGELDDPIDDDTQESSDDLISDSRDIEP